MDYVDGLKTQILCIFWVFTSKICGHELMFYEVQLRTIKLQVITCNALNLTHHILEKFCAPSKCSFDFFIASISYNFT